MAGYSGTPLAKKLGVKPGMRLIVIAPPGSYAELLAELPAGVHIEEVGLEELAAGRPMPNGAVAGADGTPPGSAAAPFVHLFAKDLAALAEGVVPAKSMLAKDGLLWISWPKRSSGVETDVSESDVRSHGLEAGLVDVKICAVDDTWSGLKFVYRLADR